MHHRMTYLFPGKVMKTKLLQARMPPLQMRSDGKGNGARLR